MRLDIKSVVFLVSILLFAGSTFAAKFDRLIVFGDSLSDNGNGTYILTNRTVPPSPPYFDGRFCNGPVWNDYLADEYGFEVINIAYGGATTNYDFQPGLPWRKIPGVKQQIQEYIDKGATVSDKDLYALMFFGNDYFYSLEYAKKVVAPEDVVEQIVLNLEMVYDFGARFILTNTLDLPTDEKSVLYKPIKVHNKLLRKSTKSFSKDHPDVILKLVEADKIFPVFTTKEFQEETGITKGPDEACINHEASDVNSTTPVCDDPEKYLLFDLSHYTTKVHEYLSSKVFLGLVESY